MNCDIEKGVRAASQISLLGEVTINLRAVNIILEDEILLLKFYYELSSEEEEDIPEMVALEMLSFFEGEYEIITQTFITPTIVPIPQEGIRVFYRKE